MNYFQVGWVSSISLQKTLVSTAIEKCRFRAFLISPFSTTFFPANRALFFRTPASLHKQTRFRKDTEIRQQRMRRQRMFYFPACPHFPGKKRKKGVRTKFVTLTRPYFPIYFCENGGLVTYGVCEKGRVEKKKSILKLPPEGEKDSRKMCQEVFLFRRRGKRSEGVRATRPIAASTSLRWRNESSGCITRSQGFPSEICGKGE